MPHRPPHVPAPDAPASEQAEFTRAVFQMLNEHDGRINAHDTHAHTVAAQVAELTISMDALRREIPTLMAAGLKMAVSDPGLWAAAGEAMHQQARSAAGGRMLTGAAVSITGNASYSPASIDYDCVVDTLVV